MNLLTEDNLPYYTDRILGALTAQIIRSREWTCQWTMEENRHAMVMRDWVHISRCINPTTLEDGRRVQMQKAEVPHPATFAELIAYVSFQERATQIAHRNTGAKLPKDDKIGRNVLGAHRGRRDQALPLLSRPHARRVRHRSLGHDDRRLQAGEHVRDARHGHSELHSSRRAHRQRGDLRTRQYLSDVLTPVLSLWDVEHLKGLTKEAEIARIDLVNVQGEDR